jgi:hypothetical protein
MIADTGEDRTMTNAIRALEDIDSRHNLYASLLVLSFLVSCAMGIWAFFILSDISLWGDDIGEFAARAITALSWVMIFPIWIVSFTGFVVILGRLGVTDIGSEARSRLTAMALSRDDLVALRDNPRSHTWRHRRIFRTVISELLDQS